MSWPLIVERLQRGESVEIRPSGSSMTPRIKSKQLVTIAPYEGEALREEMIVLAKVNGRYYLHKITAFSGDRIQISNNHGHINGWTTKEKIYGLVRQVS